MRQRLDAIAFDAGTQIREAISESVVAEYAERMAEGVTFPPVVLFHDGNRHYLADGFHRYMAAQRNGWIEIDADVRAGTKEDALWFALGANKANAHRMTAADKRHAVVLAVRTWPDEREGRSLRQIADQTGCSHEFVRRVKAEQQVSTVDTSNRVTGKDGKSYPASTRLSPERIAAAENKLRAGVGVTQVGVDLRMKTETVRKIQSAAGIADEGVDKSREAVAKRRQDIRDMATRGYTTRQIAASLSVTEETVAAIAKTEAIVIHADRAVGKTRRHDSTRIVEHIVMDAENLTADVNLIDFSALDCAQIAGWLDSLKASRDKLGAFIRRLMQEQQKNGEAA